MAQHARRELQDALDGARVMTEVGADRYARLTLALDPLSALRLASLVAHAAAPRGPSDGDDRERHRPAQDEAT